MELLSSIVLGGIAALVATVGGWQIYKWRKRKQKDAWIIEVISEILGRGWSTQYADMLHLAWLDELEQEHLLTAKKSEIPRHLDVFLCEERIPMVGPFNVELPEDAPDAFLKTPEVRAKARAFLKACREAVLGSAPGVDGIHDRADKPPAIN
ncbi:MAG: hypothetical protein ACT4TC_10980 [Myxococcaceae bacterium]